MTVRTSQILGPRSGQFAGDCHCRPQYQLNPCRFQVAFGEWVRVQPRRDHPGSHIQLVAGHPVRRAKILRGRQQLAAGPRRSRPPPGTARRLVTTAT